MAALIQYVRKLKESETYKIIIFSQWDDLLHKVGDTLRAEGVQNAHCQGNVHVRTKMIQSFQQSNENQVIMLSLENAASGSTLTNTTHIILLDAVVGTK